MLEFEQRYSVLIAMIWVILMFSASMPSLYLAGILLITTMYWTDKILFLKFYAIPPRHGPELAAKARNIIEWSLLLHLFMGLYMLSQPDIFTSEDDPNLAVNQMQNYAKFIAIGIQAVTGVESDRFGQVHTVLYSVGIGIFLILFIVEKLTSFISTTLAKVCCCCLNRDASLAAFSDDISKEISLDVLQKEYEDTKLIAN